jgi:hypothetical protein
MYGKIDEHTGYKPDTAPNVFKVFRLNQSNVFKVYYICFMNVLL